MSNRSEADAGGHRVATGQNSEVTQVDCLARPSVRFLMSLAGVAALADAVLGLATGIARDPLHTHLHGTISLRNASSNVIARPAS